MKKFLLLASLLAAPTPALAASDFDGIWIMLTRPGFYYDITVANGTVVFVQLENVSTWGNLVGVWQATTGTLSNNTAQLTIDNTFATTQMTLVLNATGVTGSITINSCTAKQSNVVCETAGTVLGIQKVF